MVRLISLSFSSKSLLPPTVFVFSLTIPTINIFLKRKQNKTITTVSTVSADNQTSLDFKWHLKFPECITLYGFIAYYLRILAYSACKPVSYAAFACVHTRLCECGYLKIWLIRPPLQINTSLNRGFSPVSLGVAFLYICVLRYAYLTWPQLVSAVQGKSRVFFLYIIWSYVS